MKNKCQLSCHKYTNRRRLRQIDKGGLHGIVLRDKGSTQSFLKLRGKNGRRGKYMKPKDVFSL